MMPHLIVLLTLFNLHTAGSSLVVELSPANPLFRFGDRSQLTCRWSHCSEPATFTWSALQDKPLFAEIQSSSNESTLIYRSINQNHENTILCRAKCKDVFKQAKAKVRVYSFPRAPVISGHDRLVLGKESTVVCQVSDVYPGEYMKIEWLLEGKVVHTDDGEPDKKSIQSSYTFTPQSDDGGKQITCRASLVVDGLAPEESIKEAAVSVTLFSAPHNMRASEPSPVTVGSSLSLKCEVDGNPKPDFSWRLLSPAGPSVRVGETQELSLLNVSLSDAGEYECEASNTLGKVASKVTVTIHDPPVNTMITVSPEEPKEMDSLTISCMSESNTAARLALSKVLEGNKTEMEMNHGPRVSVIYSYSSLGDSGLYICEAINDYGRQTAEIYVNVKTYPLEVSLQPESSVIPVKRGSFMTLSCKASGCPHPSITWQGVKQSPELNWTDAQIAVSQLGPWTVELDDDRSFICEVKCGSVVKSRGTKLKVYSFPSELIIESSGPFLEGSVSKLTCTVRDVYPADCLRIQWLDGEKELHSQRGTFSHEPQILSSTLIYRPDATDQNKTLTCKASLEMDDALRQSLASITLVVHYAPKNTAIVVTPHGELKEGEPVSISCLTTSFPEGQVILKKVLDGVETELVSDQGTLTSLSIPSAELLDSGVYVCEAFNEYGHQRASVQLSVLAPPRNTTVRVYPSAQVHEGQNVTICCQAVSFPPSAIMLRKMDNGTDIYSLDGTFLLINVTLKDTGLYQVNFTNALGFETEFISIQVMESLSSPPSGSTTFIIPVVCLGLLTAAAGALEYLRRSKRKGFYKLSACNPGNV